MIDFLLVLLILIAQLIPTWIIHNQVADDHEKKVGWWIASVLVSLLGGWMFNNYYWFLINFPFFFIYEWKKREHLPYSLIYFISIYSVFIPLLLTNLMTLFLYTVPKVSFVNDSEISWVLWSVIGSVVIHVGIVRIMKIDFSILKSRDPYVRNKIIIPSIVALTFGLFLFLIPYSLERQSPNSNSLHGYTKYIFFVYIFLFISLLLFLSLQAKNFLQREVQMIKEEQYAQLTRYTQEIEQLYQQIRGFRHDFGNILSSLGESISTGEIEQIKQVYEDVLVQANIDLNKSSYGITELSYVSNIAVKSVLSAKLMSAEQKDIHVSLEIKKPIVTFIIETLDYVRILSILLDNAIEAAEQSETKQLKIALFVEHMQLVTVICNSKSEDVTVSVERIFDTGFSTKGIERGTGLSNVREILGKYNRATIDTVIENKEFKQILILREGAT
ncbi:GHKL domain-containing protein [Enterococcus sp. MJM12]|uniref:GHKL domain-containing protein n=1 Tax=Candidatus Enterococcus myersii TaxID=2815322 RepID=A0ABS3H7Z7_9ENTE|nr:sensor histidine kinase [Enterococcus sp. MJM12]MBO0449177.1 GHKL domain-containing protein [Enterococcus sp. MJM12]